MFDQFYEEYRIYRLKYEPLYKLVPTAYIILFAFFGAIILVSAIYTILHFNYYTSAIIFIGIIGVVVVDFRTERIIKKILLTEREQDKAFVAQYLMKHHITSYTQVELFAKNLEILSNTKSRKINLIPYIAALVSIFIYIADDADEIEPVIIWVSIILVLVDPLYNFIYNIFFDRKYKRFYELARMVEEVYIEGMLVQKK